MNDWNRFKSSLKVEPIDIEEPYEAELLGMVFNKAFNLR